MSCPYLREKKNVSEKKIRTVNTTPHHQLWIEKKAPNNTTDDIKAIKIIIIMNVVDYKYLLLYLL